jgi:hypothetical protein
MLDHFGFPEQALVDGQFLKPLFLHPDPVPLRFPVCAPSFRQVVGIMSYVTPLCLDYGSDQLALRLPRAAHSVSAKLTIREHAHSQYVPVLGEVGECHVGRALADHQVNRDQALEYNSPCRVAQSVLQCSEDLSDACFSRMSRDEDMLYVLRLGRRSL